MFVVLLPLSENRSRAPELLEPHKAWIQRGLDDGVFLLAGGLKPQGGGMILAQGISRDDLEARVGEDPFVKHGVVRSELIEFAPSFATETFRELLDGRA